jgi:hypothetical protein
VVAAVAVVDGTTVVIVDGTTGVVGTTRVVGDTVVDPTPDIGAVDRNGPVIS